MTEPTAPVLRGDPFSEPLAPFVIPDDDPVPAGGAEFERHCVEALARVSNAFHFMLHSDDERQGQEALSRVLDTLRTVEPVILKVAPVWFPEWFAEEKPSGGPSVGNSADHV